MSDRDWKLFVIDMNELPSLRKGLEEILTEERDEGG